MSRGGGGSNHHYHHHHGGSEKVMRLNVGGSFYTTTKQTLQSVEGSVLFRIATGQQHCPKDDRGYYVIDRDGHAFRFVLNFLRTSKLIVPMGYRELDILKEEADYYGLDEMINQIDGVIESRKKRNRGRRWNGAARKLSASVGENLHLLQEEVGMGDDFFEDSWIV